MSTFNESSETVSPRAIVFNTLGVLLLFGLFSWVQSPIPGINEPHYLCKAKHFWDSSYCPGDFFLDSSDTHYVFYVMFGWLTMFLSLETTALVGRIVVLSLLSFGWTMLASRVARRSCTPILSAGLFLGLAAFQNFSGEWIVGGIESKVPAYGFVFLGWAMLFGQQWRRAGLFLGLGIAFHPVVGGWSLIATVLGMLLVDRKKEPASLVLPSKKIALQALAILILVSLPGLIPALATLFQTNANSALADRIQVFRRLGHHLNPALFSVWAWIVYGVMLVIWSVLVWKSRSEANSIQKLWRAIVVGSLLITLGGLVVAGLQMSVDVPAVQTWCVKLMKFYPFRLFDVLLPIALCVELCHWGLSGIRPKQAILVLVALGMFGYSLAKPLPSRKPEGHSVSKRESWIEICTWIDTHLPEDVELITPMSGASFKWYASRAQFVCFKDCPQDAAGLLEWERRRNLYGDWASDNYSDNKYSREETATLQRESGAEYLLTSRMGPFEIEPIYRNAHYRLYRLPKTGAATETPPTGLIRTDKN